MKTASIERADFIAYPTNRVVGTVGDAAKAQAAIDALLQAGFDRQQIDLLHGEEALHRLDPTGAEHGFLAQFHRRVIRTFELEEFKQLRHHVDDVRAGRFVITVLTKRRALRILAADILHQHGAEFVGFYGRWASQEIPPTIKSSPEEIPALFARAWNGHDSDALASLFDEDAEFVNGTGLCWHDRKSIRDAHAQRMPRAVGAPTSGDVKVKLLSPDVAVVHTRMTLIGDDAVADVGSRTTIVSFVVHRTGDRWVCASIHNTDVMASAESTVMDSAAAG